MSETPQHQINLLAKKEIAPQVWELRFSKPQGFTFFAGQFVQCEIPTNEGMVLRPYSFSSIPSDPYLEFCIKYVPEGKASGHFSKMQIGETLTVRGPLRVFVSKDITTPLYGIATGVGLAPLMGIIRDELENKKRTSAVTLLFGVRHDEDVFWNDQLEKLAQQFSNFSYRLTLSQPSDLWQGSKGRVSAHIPGNVAGKQYYICGNVNMVKDVRTYLVARGIPAMQVHLEIF